jgi:hypothetical protein
MTVNRPSMQRNSLRLSLFQVFTGSRPGVRLCRFSNNIKLTREKGLSDE